MKTKLTSIAFAIMAASAVIAADTTVKTTTVQPDGSSTTTIKTTTSTGIINEFVDGTTFIMKEATGPVTYVYGKTVVYATKAGKLLTNEEARQRIKVGLPVSVHYLADGTNRVISRVIIDD